MKDRPAAKMLQNSAPAAAPVAALLAWLMPGLGHWYIGERGRGAILFVVMTATFWTGVAIGGVRTTVTERENGPWIAAQVCMGPQALGALLWSRRERATAGDENKALWPASNISVVYAGITGLLNLLVIIDVLARTERVGIIARRPPGNRPT